MNTPSVGDVSNSEYSGTSLNKGHIGDNINSLVSFVERVVLFSKVVNVLKL